MWLFVFILGTSGVRQGLASCAPSAFSDAKTQQCAQYCSISSADYGITEDDLRPQHLTTQYFLYTKCLHFGSVSCSIKLDYSLLRQKMQLFQTKKHLIIWKMFEGSSGQEQTRICGGSRGHVMWFDL